MRPLSDADAFSGSCHQHQHLAGNQSSQAGLQGFDREYGGFNGKTIGKWRFTLWLMVNILLIMININGYYMVNDGE